MMNVKSTYFEKVKAMHTKFGIDNNRAFASALEKEEYLFRIGAMFEELWEYVGSVFDFQDSNAEDPDKFRKFVVDMISQYDLKDDVGSEESLEKQMDALIDLQVFSVGTAERQGFNNDEGFSRVMKANMAKEVAGGKGETSKRGFKADLIKPEGWEPPTLTDLVARPKGIVVIEGPDGAGKSSIAEWLVQRYGAVSIHATWSKELEEVMPKYLNAILDQAERLSQRQLVVLDRHYISELIYSDVFRIGTQYPDLAGKCFNRLAEMNACYVFCVPFTERTTINLLSRFDQLRNERPEMYDTMADCISAFQTIIMGESVHGKYKFNTKENKSPFIEEGPLVPRIRNYQMYDIEFDPEYEDLDAFIWNYVTRVNK